jgi:ketosteroid isomerase-like protein
MSRLLVALPMLVLMLAACSEQPAPLATGDTARAQVEATERHFARTMAERDLAAFGQLVAEEAVFFSGPEPLQGREQVVEWWSRFFRDPQAPFSWEPDRIEVLASGTLALSTGPVHDPKGNLTGRFVSIWRQEAPGSWKIVFDRGEAAPLPPAN